MQLTDDGHIYFPTNNGQWISEKQRRINEILQDYDSNLQLQWIPPGSRNEKDDPFRVVCFPPGKPAYLVCTGQEADERLLATVFQADQKRNNGNLLNWLDNYNRAIEIYNAKKNEEIREEAHEIARSALKSDKSHYRVNSLRTGELIDLERPGHSESSKTYIW